MKYWMFAVLFAAACASPEPAAAPQQGGAAPAEAAQSSPTYDDARSSASDAEVRDARRAYRYACQQGQSEAYCECMTGGMAQALAPRELAVATAALTGQNVAASTETRSRVDSVRTEVDRGCVQFRR